MAPAVGQQMLIGSAQTMPQAMMLSPRGMAQAAALPQAQWSSMYPPDQMMLQGVGAAPMFEQATPWPSPLVMAPAKGEAIVAGGVTPHRQRCSCWQGCCARLRACCQRSSKICCGLASCTLCRRLCSGSCCRRLCCRGDPSSSSSSCSGNSSSSGFWQKITAFFQGRWQSIAVAAAGLVALGCLLAALIASPPHLLGAGLSAVLGWLACYGYMLQLDCRRLARTCGLDLVDVHVEDLPVPGASPPHPTSAEANMGYRAAAQRGLGGDVGQTADLDLTMLAGSLGVTFGDGLLGSAASVTGRGKKGGTMQAVLMAALVNEYLRCAALLRKYQSRHGKLRNAPSCDLGFAEALLAGLSGDAAMIPVAAAQTSLERPDSPLRQAISPAPVQSGASTSDQASARPTVNGEGSPAPAAPSASGTSQAESAALGALQARARLDNSVNDPPWLRQIRHTASRPEEKEGPQWAANLDTSVNDPPWLKEIKRAHK